jgi:hypothetical protein
MNLTDTSSLLALRPEIPTEPAQNPAEHFQNTTLRPILKFLHPRIITLFTHHLHKRKVDVQKMDVQDRKMYVLQAFQKDLALRNQLVGCALALFTEEEWATFIASERELSRRLHDLLVERIQSTLN